MGPHCAGGAPRSPTGIDDHSPRGAGIYHSPRSSQSVTTTLLAGSSWTTHTLLFFYFEYGDNLCIVVFFSCLPPGPALQDDDLFPPLFTFASCR
eukprot:scaffold34896_cov68-Phaeocystis_antarctica.AAC.1